MMINLILQSLKANVTDLRRIAQRIAPKQSVEISPHCIHCIGCTVTDHDATEINQLAYQEQVDVYWDSLNKKLSDFKLLIMDMDSTLINIECIDEIADIDESTPDLKTQVATITEAAMRGEIAFAESLTRRVALLSGLPASALQRVYDERLNFSPGAEKLVHAVQAAGIKILLVSGGFTYFTERIKARLNLDYSHSNQLEILDGKLTGRILGKIVDAEEKRHAVERTCAELAIMPGETIVIGDGANDLAMMEIAGLSVAFRAKPIVRAKANVALNFVGLDGVLNLF